MAEWHKRGWLSPSGELHSIEGYGSHTDWLLAHPEHWEPGKHQAAMDAIDRGEGKHYAAREGNAHMLRRGWVRQAGRGMYELGDRRHLRKVLDHVMMHYPDIDQVTVDIGYEKPTTHTINVHEELMLIQAAADALLAGADPRAVVEQVALGRQPGRKAHPNSYPWHDGHTRYGRGQLIEDDAEAHAWNPQAVRGKVTGYADVARHFGHIVPNAGADLKHYQYGPEHTEKIDRMLGAHGYKAYYAGGKYGQPNLQKHNYDTGHLMIWNPDEGSGGDFGHRAYTDAWRKVHELAHAITKPAINAKYGEAPRIGKLGHHRSQHEAERAVEWEWHAAHKQRELSAQLGVHVPDHVFHKELNTVMHDAVHRAVTGKFTNPDQEGFVPHGHKVPLETSLALVRQHAQRLGLTNRHQTFKKSAAAVAG